MNSITIGSNPIGVKIAKSGVNITIGGGGSAPEPPTPAPVAVYGSWIGVADPLLTGFVTDDWEEDQNGN